MTDCKFKERDVVTVLHHGKPSAITRVRRVMGRFVELDSGSKWLPNGAGRYPRAKWDTSSIAHATTQHGDELKRARLITGMGSVEWSSLTTDQLRRVMAIVNEPKP